MLEPTSARPIPEPRVLLVCSGDEGALLYDWLSTWTYVPDLATTIEAAGERLLNTAYDLVVVGLKAESGPGLELVDAARRSDATVPVMFITDPDADRASVEALRRGAFQYFNRPLNPDEVRLVLGQALTARQSDQTQRELLREARDKCDFESMVGRTSEMRLIFDLIDRICDSTAAVLIHGESGTGKELIARAIHFRGRRGSRPFVPVNCAAIPSTLLESELFGYERGAFTGASKPRPGLFVQASGGTLFLDEIGDMPFDVQPKLLRVLQEGEVRAVGSDKSRTVDVRIVAATHVDLRKRVKDSKFRQDLYYRLNVVPIDVPPLRERLDDIPVLAERLLELIARGNPKIVAERLSPEAMELLTRHDWPGNIRELNNVLERAATLASTQTIGIGDLRFLDSRMEIDTVEELFQGQPTLREVEERYIAYVMKQTANNRVRAAAILGVDPSTLYRRSKRKR